MNCPKCQRPAVDGAKFCRHCGSPITSEHAVEHARKRAKLWMPYAIAGSALLLSLGIAGAVLTTHKAHPAVAAATSQTGTSAKPLTVKDIIHNSLPSTVLIDVTSDGGEDLGSGFLYDRQGDVLTNAHVVNQARNITVKTQDGTAYPGTLIGVDPAHDIAAIRVPTLANTASLTLGNSDDVQLGDAVVAIGNPMGLKDTVTSGLISGLGRDFTIENTAYHNMFQISAPIAPGNSGGPLLLQSDGSVIGINSAGSNSAGNIGFSIPINQVKAQATAWAQTPETPAQLASAMDTAPATATGGTGSAGSADGPDTFAQTCIRDISQFYTDVASGDYLDAYNMYGQKLQEQTPYAAFTQGYANTISGNPQNPVVVSSSVNSAEVTFSLVAGDRAADGSVHYTVYHMDFTFALEDGQAKIVHATGQQVQ